MYKAVYSYYPQRSTFTPKLPWNRMFFSEYSKIERRKIQEYIHWKKIFDRSLCYSTVPNFTCFIRKVEANPSWMKSLKEFYESTNIWVSVPYYAIDAGRILTIFKNDASNLHDGMHLELINPKKVVLFRPKQTIGEYALFVEDYEVLKPEDLYRDFKPERTGKHIITNWLQDILEIDTWLSEIVCLPPIGAPIFSKRAPGIDMQMNIFGLTEWDMERISSVLSTLLPINFRNDIPTQLLNGKMIHLTNGINFKLSEITYDLPFLLRTTKVGNDTLHWLRSKPKTTELSHILYGGIGEDLSKFDLSEALIKYLNIPLFLDSEHFPVYKNKLLRIFPDEDVQQNVVYRHLLNPVIISSDQERTFLEHIRKEIRNSWEGILAITEEEHTTLFESLGGFNFCEGLLQAAQSEARLLNKKIVERDHLEIIINTLTDSFDTLFRDEEFIRKQKVKKRRKIEREGQRKFDAIKYALLGEPKGLTIAEIFDKRLVKTLFKSQDEVSEMLTWMRVKGYVYEIENNYIWI